MNGIDLTSSSNSNTSSETSDTQSVEGNAQQAINKNGFSANLSSRYSRKRMKDSSSEKERPPWRAVSVSTLPKPDKNAILRARLLDASRRLRAGKISIGIQTDIEPTKMVKEASIGAQVDLILHREIGILTDGSYAKRREGNDEFILTYSVALLTDIITTANVSTQTMMPKLPGDNFRKAYYEGDANAVNSSEFSELEKKLLQQIQKIRATTEHQAVTNLNGNNPISQETDTTNFRPSLLTPTLKSWHFEYDEMDCTEDRKYFQPYTISPNRPWNSFTPLLFNMRNIGPIGNRTFNWHLLLNAIDDLVQECNRLVDMIEDLTMQRQKNVCNFEKLKKMENFKHESITLPSEHWLPIIEQQEKELNQCVERFNKQRKTTTQATTPASNDATLRLTQS